MHQFHASFDRRRGALCFLLWIATACSPSLNWREAQVAGAGAVALFPCKPDEVVRKVVLADTQVDMALLSCSVDGVTFALSHAEMREPAQPVQALQQLQALAPKNVNGSARGLGPFAVPGMTPSPLANRIQVVGTRSDGRAVNEHLVFFIKGLRVFQASVVGTTLDAAATDVFLAGLKLPS